MPTLSYSFHLSTKSHSVSTTGKVLQVSRHNLRQYKSDSYNQELINIIRGSDTSILDDVKRIYHEEFDDALAQYNKGKRSDRVINDYLEHVSESRGDVACEIIIQIGDRDFWENARQKGWSAERIKGAMSPIFQSQLGELERLVPELKIASAVEHYDESSPHMHVVGIPVATGYKKGLSKQVAKTKVFTPDRLSHLQDRMREAADEDISLCDSMIFCNDMIDDWHIDPDGKKPGRNRDIPKKSLDEYYRTKREKEALENEKIQLESSIKKKKSEEKWIDVSIATKRELNDYLDIDKRISEEEISALENKKKLVEMDIIDLREKKKQLSQEFSQSKGDIEALDIERNILHTEITRLQEQKKQLKRDVVRLDQEKDAAQSVINEANTKNASLRQLQLQIEQAQEEMEELTKKEKDAENRLSELSVQADEKLSIIDTDLSPEFVHQMLNDTITSNLVQETALQTCKQLGSLGYLNVGPTTAFLKINKDSILNNIKAHVTDFIEDVKHHISKMIINHRKTKRRGR